MIIILQSPQTLLFTSRFCLLNLVTDENSESESDTEEKLKGEMETSHQQKLHKCDYKTASYLCDVISNICACSGVTHVTDVAVWNVFPPAASSQPAARVSPVHAEADREVPDFGEGSDGATGEETL